jgi:hypothetical protein
VGDAVAREKVGQQLREYVPKQETVLDQEFRKRKSSPETSVDLATSTKKLRISMSRVSALVSELNDESDLSVQSEESWEWDLNSAALEIIV